MDFPLAVETGTGTVIVVVALIFGAVGMVITVVLKDSKYAPQVFGIAGVMIGLLGGGVIGTLSGNNAATDAANEVKSDVEDAVKSAP